MKTKAFKLFFVSTLILINTVCYAGEKEELKELQENILNPITNHFKGHESRSKKMSEALLRLQTDQEKNFTTREASDALDRLKQTEFKDKVDPRCREIGYLPLSKSELISRHVQSWELKFANCVQYAGLVMTAFEFNKMNIMAERSLAIIKLLAPKQLFKGAWYVSAKPGDHVFVLIEGISGIVYAIDPWNSDKVVALKNFPDLSALYSDIYRIGQDDDPDDPLQQTGKQLTELFAHTYKGKQYYDQKFVRTDTYWILIPGTEPDSPMFGIWDSDMKELYDKLFSAFPLWKYEYSKELLSNYVTPNWNKPKPKTKENDDEDQPFKRNVIIEQP